MNEVTDTNPEPRFDLAAFDLITANMGYDNDAKRLTALRMSNGVLSRIRAGTHQPGAKFIRRLVAMGIPYKAVFPDRPTRTEVPR